MSAKIEISEVQEVVIGADEAEIVVKAEALVGDEATQLEIAITTDLAPAMAIALLATTAKARAARDGLEPALEVLAAAVVASGSAEKVRLQLLFDKGAVLPVEMPEDAGAALRDGLVRDALERGQD
jgi:hypothetical protein